MNQHHLTLRTILLALVLAGAPALAQTAAPSNSATPITKVPFTIKKPGLYLLKKNLSFAKPTGAAITIEASDVTLDLGGHVLTSTAPQDDTNESIGVVTPPAVQDVTVRNGALRNFNVCVALSPGPSLGRCLVENLVVTHSGTLGIFINADSAEVRDCQVLATGYKSVAFTSTGISVAGNTCRVADNEVFMNGTGQTCIGITTSFIGLIERNRVTTQAGIGTGINSSLGFIVENTIYGFATGINMVNPTVKYRANLTVECATKFVGGTAVGTDNN